MLFESKIVSLIFWDIYAENGVPGNYFIVPCEMRQ